MITAKDLFLLGEHEYLRLSIEDRTDRGSERSSPPPRLVHQSRLRLSFFLGGGGQGEAAEHTYLHGVII